MRDSDIVYGRFGPESAEPVVVPVVIPEERLAQVDINIEIEALVANIQILKTTPEEPVESFDEREAQRREDRKALFNKLVKLTEPWIYGKLYSLFEGNRLLTDEAFQGTYFRAWRHIDSFKGTARFTTWLTTIAINESHSVRAREKRFDQTANMLGQILHPHIRRHHDATNSLEDDSHERILDPTSELPFEQADDRNDAKALTGPLLVALDGLNKKSRTIVYLRAVEELPFPEIAVQLGITVNTTKVRYLRAMKKLREKLGPELNDEVESGSDDSKPQETTIDNIQKS